MSEPSQTTEILASPPAAAPKPPMPKKTVGPKETGPPKETGGPKGPEPTRYGDWEVKGRCTDF